MLRSLWSAVSGLTTHQMEMDVIGNNISNVNTSAFKSETTGFKDILYQTMRSAGAPGNNRAATNSSQIGLGARVGSIYTNITTQGSAITTNNPFDLMITGDSFFVVSAAAGAANQDTFFTRDGSFLIDSNGYLVTQDGLYVNFLEGTGVGGEVPLISDATKSIAGTATSEAVFKGNIDRYDNGLTDGKTISLEVFGADGNVYNLKFNLTDAGDNDDTTYLLSLQQIMDKDGNTIRGNSDKLLLKYGAADGELEGIIPYTTMYYGDNEETLDESGKVTETQFSVNGTIGVHSEYGHNVVGKDGKTYTLIFSTDYSEEENADYDFSLTGVIKPDGERVDFDESVALDFDGLTGQLVTVNDTAESSYTFKFDKYDKKDDRNLDIGPVVVDFSELKEAVVTGNTYKYDFTGDASVLGSITVDFAYTHNYAGQNSGHVSSINALKGNINGENKGYANGEMSGISISNDGSIIASYTSGRTVTLAQIAVAQFTNAMGLDKVGTNLYKASANSGDPMYYDITTIDGTISSGVLEGSNVDLAKEFTDMITTQRGFQANSKVITTSDEILQILKGLKP
ncbi:flagellar hook protein FlgE [Butyrivibrio sp. YAB3001]|uniref:flagellar hook protein FlgE n=1 Tax=Butyrivibrio sp. YAB3001 TaxID=1520812 RepID=UPI0008F65B11|nr:flagellar hook-basal body complex protein [Butyrivibrio sp. YAB3001]SFC43266.1 flagellar hook protein FlgE [Butyrivibrio sp. YAB3001]